ncbi:MAG: hypothetical protein QOF83_2635 [Solirubrobacteraceae bacterium]|jgi:pimeloyl-ACP methyl ester carboxylesterase|nr:hypothetical protein [Solirubrobacteraceae bacterium]
MTRAISAAVNAWCLLHGLASFHRLWERVIPLLGEDCAARSLHDRVGTLPIPVDVVFGLEDRRVARSSLDAYDRLGNVTVTRVAGVGHTPPLEAPQAVADVPASRTGAGSRSQALCRTRTDDPFLTMEVLYQLS